MNKLCTRCKKDKPVEEFNWKIKNKKRQHYCKLCQSEYTRNHYKNNKKPYIDRARENKKRAKLIIAEYLSSHCCVDCGITDIRVLEFDHVSGEKKYNIATMANSGMSEKTIRKEIEKCEIRCANCHRIRHAVGGWRGAHLG